LDPGECLASDPAGGLLTAGQQALIMLVLHVLSVYIGHMYLEVKRRPPYIVMERQGRGSEQGDRQTGHAQ
jgi:hypothetical protein